MSGAGPGGGLELLIDRQDRLKRAALVIDGRLSDLYLDRSDRPSRVGAIYRGRVRRIVAGLNGAFVDLGDGGREGLLVAADVRPRAKEPGEPIGRRLSAGQSLLVQVKAEAVGTKGPTLTMDLALPGRFLVHTPLTPSMAVSRRLGKGPEAAGIKRLLAGLAVGQGWIVRAAAGRAGPERLEREAETLTLEGRELLALAGAATAPGLLRAPPPPAVRALIDYAGHARWDALSRIRLERDRDRDQEQDQTELVAWCRALAPDLEPCLEAHRGPPGLFDAAGLEEALAALRSPRVALSGGASLVIEPTEALVAIDVNGGERGNPLAVNLEAAAEIARQLRLRHLAGIVVVDFVSMKRREDGEQLLALLTRAVADDPVPTEVYGLSRLGLVELTRARRGPALAELLAGLEGGNATGSARA